MSNINQLVMENLFENKTNSSSYDEFFQAKMNEWGISSPRELDAQRRKEFFNEVDKEYKAKNDRKW